MKHVVRIVVLMTAVAATGCMAEAQTEAPVVLKAFALADVQGLFGGQSLWVRTDRTAFVQTVGHEPGRPGLQEKRVQLTVTPSQWREVERLVAVHHLLTLKIPQRPGIPDEAHPTITLVTGNGSIVHVGKWANDKIPDFDAVYAYLLALCRGQGTLLHEGDYDWKWHPDGFEAP